MSAVAMFAMTSVRLAQVVGRGEPFHSSVAPDARFVPSAAMANPWPPAVAVFGVSLVRVGAGAGVVVKVWAFDTWPSGFRTVTDADPAVAMSAAAMLARNRVALTTVVVRTVPFQRTVPPDTKLVPSTVSGKSPPPAMAVLGVSAVVTGGPPP